MFEFIKESSAKRVINKATRELNSTKVEIESRGTDEATLVVDGHLNVWLAPDDWECNCRSKMNPCHHVVMAVMALENGSAKLKHAANTAGHMRYKLSSENDGVYIRRVWVSEHKESTYNGQGTLSEYDQSLQRLFEREFSATRPVAKERLHDLLIFLAKDPKADITFNNQPRKVSGELVRPVAMVQDHPRGFIMRLGMDPKVRKNYKGGLMLHEDKGNFTIRKYDRTLTKEAYSHLVKGIIYTHDEIQELVCEAIPNIKQRIQLFTTTEKLPTAVEATPYILIDTVGKEENASSIQSMEVSAQLVYGDPIIATVHNEQLHIEEGIQNTIPIRDISKERSLIHQYRNIKLSSNFPLGVKKEFTLDKINDVLTILNRLTKNPNVRLGGFAKTIKVKDMLTPEVSVAEDDISVDWDGVESEGVFEAWANNQRFILLRDGSLHELPQNWLEENGGLVRDLLLAKEKANDKLPSFALFDLAKLCKQLNHPPPANLDNLRVLVGDFAGIPDATLPTDLNATLRDYQRDGVNWLSFLKDTKIGGILADDMGLGKTLQALCILEHQSLVVAPTSVLHNWIAETKKFRPSLSVCLYHGTGRVLDTEANIILTSYAILRNDIEKLQEINWKVVVLDEAQAIKNPKSLTAQAAFKINADVRLTLTGTPIENRLTELWSQMHFLCPGLLGGHSSFTRQYEQPIMDGQADAAARLRNKIKPFILRRLKKEVALELPPRTNQILYCTLSEDERKTYDAIRVATQQDIVQKLESGELNVMNALEALLRLRQASCHQGLIPTIEAETSSKVKALTEKLEEVTNSGHKALVFSQWTSLLNLIEPHLKQKEIQFVRLDGSTKDRQTVVNKFKSDKQCSVFLSSLKAGGVGLNLTEADHVFLVDPWWNPAVEDQAADRAHRIGQTKSVIVYRLVSKDTVEERILVLQDRKRQLAETALGGASKGASITKDDLLELLR